MTNEELNTFMRAAGFVPLVKYERVHPSFDREATWRHGVYNYGAYVEVVAWPDSEEFNIKSFVSIERILVHKWYRKMNYATIAIRAICAQADKDHITLKLYATNWLGADPFDLVKWYNRFGFVSSLSDRYAMERKPQ